MRAEREYTGVSERGSNSSSNGSRGNIVVQIRPERKPSLSAGHLLFNKAAAV